MSSALYKIRFHQDKSVSDLYVRGEYKLTQDGHILANQSDSLDFGTYFNAFSPKKWIHYTSLNKLALVCHIQGSARISFYTKLNGKEIVVQENNIFSGTSIIELELEKIQSYDVVGFRLTRVSETLEIIGLEYEGDFNTFTEKKIGIGICTFKREEYVLNNIATLEQFCEEHPHVRVTVVDNGQTLEPKSYQFIRILPNPNYGGSGGFTRAIIEELADDSRDYVLLMDDDVKLDVTALERLLAFLGGLKTSFDESIVAGAMLQLDCPTHQVEKAAYLGRLRIQSLGSTDVDTFDSVITNEALSTTEFSNVYSGWWFSCIPTKSIKRVGLPLPVFIKADDIEYGIRIDRDVITLNGIAIWHEAFAHKANPVIDYFSDRNMLMLHHYAKGCNRWTILAAIILRLGKRYLKANRKALELFDLAVTDYIGGIRKLTQTPSDKKFEQVKVYETSKSSIGLLFHVLKIACVGFMQHEAIHKEYSDFRENELRDCNFWKKFLNMK